MESPLFIARIVAWVMFNWNWSTNRSAQQPSLLRVGFESLFPRQLPATNRAFVIRTILVDYFYIEWAHIVIYIIVRTWIGQRNQYQLLRFSWNCNRANQRILFASQWQFPKRTWSCLWSETKKTPFRAHLWMYFSTVDRSCVFLFLFSTVLLNITFLKMGFIVNQWENENSVSVVSGKKVVGAVELKDGTTVDILTGTNKGRVAIYKATILKVCGK